MFDQLARSKPMVRGELFGGDRQSLHYGFLLIAQIGLPKFGPHFLRLDLIQASVDRNARDPVLERHLAGKLR